MMPMPYLLFAKILAVIAIIASLFGSGWHYGAKNVHAEWDHDKVAQLRVQQKAVLESDAHNAQVLKDQQTHNMEVATDYENKIRDLNDRLAAAKFTVAHAGGLRVSKSICDTNATGTEATGNGNHDGTVAATVALPNGVTSDLLNLAAEADRVTEIARSCQDWVKSQGFYGATP